MKKEETRVKMGGEWEPGQMRVASKGEPAKNGGGYASKDILLASLGRGWWQE